MFRTASVFVVALSATAWLTGCNSATPKTESRAKSGKSTQKPVATKTNKSRSTPVVKATSNDPKKKQAVVARKPAAKRKPAVARRPRQTAPTVVIQTPKTKPESKAKPTKQTAGPVAKSGAPSAKEKPAVAQSPLADQVSLDRFHRLLRKRPLHRTAFEGIVRHYAKRGRLKDLVADYEKRVAALPGDLPLRLLLARLYLRTNQGKKAAGILEKIDAKSSPLGSSADFLAFQSKVFQQVGRHKDAVRLLQQAIGKTKTISRKTRLIESLADIYVRNKQPDEAVKVLVDFAAEFPNQYFHRKRIAEALAQRNLHTPAIQQYQEVLKIVGKDADRRCEILRQLGRAQQKAGKPNEAIRSFTQAINLLSGDHWMQRDLHQRVVGLYRNSGRLKDLVDYCRKQIKQAPAQTAMRELLAEVLLLAGKPDEAKSSLEEAVRLFPKKRTLSRKRIALLTRLKETKGVSAEYQRVIAQFPNDVELYVDYGRFLASHKQLQAAQRQWRHVLDSKVADVTLANRLGNLFEQFELTDEAVRCYRRAIQLNAKRPQAYAALSRLWFRKGDKKKAIATVREMTAANPDDPATHARGAAALRALAMPAEALKSIEKACEQSPKEHRFHLMRSDLLLQTKKVVAGLNARRKVIELLPAGRLQQQQVGVLVSLSLSHGRLDVLEQTEADRLKREPKNTLCLLILSRIAGARQDYVAAESRLKALLKIAPNHEEARIRLARLQLAMGDLAGAEAQYRRLIAIHPARGRLYYEAIADLRARAGDRLGAVATLEELTRKFPQNAAVLQSAADRLIRLGEHQKGLDYYLKCLDRQPDNAPARLRLARSLRKIGRFEESIEHARRAAFQMADRAVAVDATRLLYDTANQLGQLDALIDSLRIRVERNPQDTTVARVLAEFYIREFEYAKASELLELVLSQNPGDVELRMLRGSLSRSLVRFDDALADYRRVLRLPNVDRDYALAEIGKVHFESGRPAEAVRTWKRIANKLYAGSLLRNNGFRAEALAILQEGLRMQPESVPLRQQLIRAYDGAGETDKALAERRRLLDLHPDNPQNIKDLASAYLVKGDRKQAAAVAARLFSLNLSFASPFSGGSQGSIMSPMMMRMYSMSGGGGQSRIDRAIEFFTESQLTVELEPIIERLLKAHPKDGLLKLAAVALYNAHYEKPEVALRLLRELDTATFPKEHQSWLGQLSQKQQFRGQRLAFVMADPALQEVLLKQLKAKKPADRSNDDRLTLAIIRLRQGQRDESLKLLKAAAVADKTDELALVLLTRRLLQREEYQQAEPYVVQAEKLAAAREKTQKPALREVVKKDFVRRLPLNLQLMVDEKRLDEIAENWLQGGAYSQFNGDGEAQFRPQSSRSMRLILGGVYAKLKRLDDARRMWKSVEPSSPANSDGWTLLAELALQHGDDELAFRYYENSMKGAKARVKDPLAQILYSNGMTWMMSFYSEQSGNSASANRIVDAFAKKKRLLEFYDFLRESGSSERARRIAKRFKLGAKLKTVYGKRVEEARKTYQSSRQDTLTKSLPYFAEVCKLAEIYQWDGDWDKAQAIYEAYLKDFPDELGLLQTLADVAVARQKHDDAVGWLHKAVKVQSRLSQRRMQWSQRRMSVIPSIPREIAATQQGGYGWMGRWGNSYSSWYGSNASPFESSATWLRIAQIRVAQGNATAAADAMDQATQVAGSNQDEVAQQCIELANRSGKTKEMLSVYRSLAVQKPGDASIQIPYAVSLEQNGRPKVAAAVYRRLLRSGVDDVDTLEKARRALGRLSPGDAILAVRSLADLEAEVKAAPGNLRKRFELAQAYYYSLRIDEALRQLSVVKKQAPYFPGMDDLLVSIYTIKGDSANLIAALKDRLKKTKDPDTRATAEQSLFSELLVAGKRDEAIAVLKKADPASSAMRYGLLLQYLGKFDDAAKYYEQAAKRGANSGGYGGSPEFSMFQSLALQGKHDRAATAIVDSAIKAMKQQQAAAAANQGVFGRGRYGNSDSNPFEALRGTFVIFPQLHAKVAQKTWEHFEKNKSNSTALQLMVSYYRFVGRTEDADKLLDDPQAKAAASDESVQARIERAKEKKDYRGALKLAQTWLAGNPQRALPPGVPRHLAARYLFASQRNKMICVIGDLHFKLGEKEKAFEFYHRIIDKDLPDSRLIYAMICLLRQRPKEARTTIDDAMRGLKVKPPALLRFRAVLALLKQQYKSAFDDLLTAQQSQDDAPQNNQYGQYYSGGGEGGLLPQLAHSNKELADRYLAFLRQRITKAPHEWSRRIVLISFLQESGKEDKIDAVLSEAAKVPAHKKTVLEYRILDAERASRPGAELMPLYRELIALSKKQVGDDASVQRFGGFGRRGGNADPTDSYRNRLGDLLWLSGKKDEAEKLWLTGKDKRSADTWYALAAAFLQRDDYSRAEGAMNKAVGIDPRRKDVQLTLAQLAFRKRNFTATLKHLQVILAQADTASLDNPAAYSGWYGQQVQTGLTISETQIAAAVRNDPAAAKNLAASQGDMAARTRLVLAASLGDWKTAQSEAQAILKKSPFDPLAVRTRLQVRIRNADWKQALSDQSQLDRITEAEVSGRHDKLRMLLAGRSAPRAAAGSRTAGPQPSAGSRGGPYGGGMGWRYRNSMSMYSQGYGEDTKPLAAMLVRLKRFNEAEIELLKTLGVEGDRTSLRLLGTLAKKTGQPRRALQLQLLESLTPNDSESPARYADALAKAGEVDKALGLLERDFRLVPSSDDSMSSMRWRMRGSPYGAQEEEETTVSPKSIVIHTMAKKHKRLAATLKRLEAEFVKSSKDQRLGRLLVDLYMLERRSSETQRVLAVLVASHPRSGAFRTRALNLFVSKKNWSAAMSLAERAAVNKDKTKSRKWILKAALIDVLSGNSQRAVKRLASLKTQPGADASEFLMLLLATKQLDRAIKFVEMPGWSTQTGGYDEDGITWLKVRLYRRAGQHAKAAKLVLQEFWKAPTIVSDSDSERLSELRALAKDAKKWKPAEKAAFDKALGRPVDRAIWELVARGPAAARAALEKILEGDAENLDARRGMIFVALRLRDPKLASEHNDKLMAWLKPRRHRVWQSTQDSEFTKKVKAMSATLVQFGDQFDSTADLLEQNGTGAQMIASLSGSNRYGGYSSQNETDVRYKALYDAHLTVMRTLLLESGRIAEWRNLGTGHDPTRGMGDVWGDSMGSSTLSQRLDNLWQNAAAYRSDNGELQQSYLNHYRLKELYALLAKRGPSLDQADKTTLADVCAALGKNDEARRYRRGAISELFIQMRKQDQPSRGFSFGEDNAPEDPDARSALVETMGEALAVSGPNRATTATRPRGWDAYPSWYRYRYQYRYRYAGYYGSDGSEVAGMALRDAVAEKALLELASEIGPGWEDTQIVRAAVKYYQLKKRPAKVLEIVARVFGEEKRPGDSFVGDYLQAAWQLKEFDRVEQTLVDLAKRFPELKSHVEWQRVMLLRHRKQHAEADKLEKRLIAGVPTPKPKPKPDALAEFIIETLTHNHSSQYGAWGNRRFESTSNHTLSDALLTVFSNSPQEALPEPAAVMSLRNARRLYADHGFHEHAVRIADVQMKRLTPDDRATRWSFRRLQVVLLHKAGQGEQARKRLAALIEDVKQHAQRSADRSLFGRISVLYAIPEIAPDYKLAVEYRRKSRKPDAPRTPDLIEAGYLHKLNLHAEAWAIYEKSLNSGKFSAFKDDTIYAAGISAHRAGQRDKALMLIRQALWRAPKHKLADTAREIVHGRSKP